MCYSHTNARNVHTHFRKTHRHAAHGLHCSINMGSVKEWVHLHYRKKIYFLTPPFVVLWAWRWYALYSPKFGELWPGDVSLQRSTMGVNGLWCSQDYKKKNIENTDFLETDYFFSRKICFEPLLFGTNLKCVLSWTGLIDCWSCLCISSWSDSGKQEAPLKHVTEYRVITCLF